MEREHSAEKEIGRLFRAKVQRRRWLSRLSFEEKILILLNLQRTADEVRDFSRGTKRRQWVTRG
jgi:hypothetical protein